MYEKKALILIGLQVIMFTLFAAVVKLADALDSKSTSCIIVWRLETLDTCGFDNLIFQIVFNIPPTFTSNC
jgi:hypothetical protein